MTHDKAEYFVTEAAESDLAAIRLYTEGNWGEAKWLEYLRGMLGAFERMALRPYSGRPRDKFAKGLRSVPYREHIVFYLPLESGPVVIQRVLHSAQNAEGIDWSEREKG